MSLNVSAILPSIPRWSPARRTEKSPTRTACSACSRSFNSKVDLPLAPLPGLRRAGESVWGGSSAASGGDCIAHPRRVAARYLAAVKGPDEARQEHRATLSAQPRRPSSPLETQNFPKEDPG